MPPAAGSGPAGMIPGGAGMPGMGSMPGAGGRKGGRGAGTGMMDGGMTGGKDVLAKVDPKAYRVDYSKRRLRTELYAVQLALGKRKKGSETEGSGLTPYVKAPADKKTLDDVTVQVEAVIRVIETLDHDATTYEKDLRKEMKKLEELTKPLPAAAAKPAAAKGVEDEIPMGGARPAAAKPPAEEPPMEEVPMAAPAKAPAGAPNGSPPAAGKAPPAGKTP